MFPPSTIEFIEAEVAAIKEKAHSLEGLVDGIYERIARLEYGVKEALLGVEHFRYPDQIKRQANCAEAAVFAYLLAKHAGLNPLILRLVDIEHRDADHLSAIIPDGSEYVIFDAVYKMKGKVELHPDHLVVHEKAAVGIQQKFSFSEVEVMGEEQLVEHIDRLNSPDGFFMYLLGSQNIGTSVVDDGLVMEFLKYNEERNSLELTFAHKGIFSFYTVLRFSFGIDQPRTRTADLYLADDFDWNRVINPFFHASYIYKGGVEELVSEDSMPVSDVQESQLVDYLLYMSFDRKKDDSGKLANFVYTAEERQRFLEKLPELSKKPGMGHLKSLLEYFDSDEMKYLKETHPVLYDLNVDYRLALVVWGDQEMSPEERIRMLLESEGLDDPGKMAKEVAESVKNTAIMPLAEIVMFSPMFFLTELFTTINSNPGEGAHSLYNAMRAAYYAAEV